MVAAPQWVNVDLNLGYPTPGFVWAPEDTDATQNTIPIPPTGTIARFRDNGLTYLGQGEFVWLPGVASLAAGDVVSYILSDGATATGAVTTRWAGTASTGRPLAVATAAVTASTSFGWFQIGGSAIVNTSGTVTAADPLYFQATAVLSHTSVAGKQVLGAIAGSANGVPDTNKTIVTLDRPCVQSQIT